MSDEPPAEPRYQRGEGGVAAGRDHHLGAAERGVLARQVAARPVGGDDGRGERRIDGGERALERRRGERVVASRLDQHGGAREAAEGDRGECERGHVAREHVRDQHRAGRLENVLLERGVGNLLHDEFLLGAAESKHRI